jgi:hypothetical protein
MQRAQTLRGWDGDRIVVPPAPEVPRRPAGRKDTKRWCGGKVGREHTYEWVRSERYGALQREPDSDAWWDERCSTCQKKRGYCWRGFGRHGRKCICGHHGSGR